MAEGNNNKSSSPPVGELPSSGLSSRQLDQQASRPASRQSSRPSSRPPSRPPSRPSSRASTQVLPSDNVSSSSTARLASKPPHQRPLSPTGSVGGQAHQQQPPRYIPGNPHMHQLRPARRQEKLGRMLKDLFKAHHEAPTGEEEDREASDAVAVATANSDRDKLQPPTLLNFLAKRMRQSDKDPGVALEEYLNHRRNSSLTDKYGELSSIVGKGAYGVVRVAQKSNPEDKKKKLVYAVKEYRPNSSESEAAFLKRLASEFCLASSMRHPNIIQTLDLLQIGKARYAGVMEYCAGGDLYSLIVVAGKLEAGESDCFFKQLVRAIAYMHEMGVAHRDIKPENLLLTSRGCVKVTDFGVAECFRMAWEHDVNLSSGVCGSGPYIAPEEYTKPNFDPRAVDVWAAGVVYLAMRTGRHLWNEAKPSDHFYNSYLVGRKSQQGYEPIEKLEHSQRRNVIYSVLDPVPSRRLTAKQILHSEWGRAIHVCPAGEGQRYDEPPVLNTPVSPDSQQQPGPSVASGILSHLSTRAQALREKSLYSQGQKAQSPQQANDGFQQESISGLKINDGNDNKK